MQELAPGEKLQCRFRTLSGMLHAPDAPLSEKLKSALALITASASVFMLKDTEATDDERYEAGLELALELVSGERASQSTAR
jgi:hypothetical protein